MDIWMQADWLYRLVNGMHNHMHINVGCDIYKHQIPWETMLSPFDG